jgi:hypothetical protein
VSVPSFKELWSEHYELLESDSAKIHFLLSLKNLARQELPEAKETLTELVARWVEE